MIRLLIVAAIVSLILFFFWKNNASKGEIAKSNIFRNILILVILIVIIVLIASQGKFLIPKLFQLIKMILPFVTKFIA